MQFWQPQHDKKLLYGVLKHGWDQWQMILKDELLGVEPVLRQELYLPQPHPQHNTLSSNIQPAAATKVDFPHFTSAAALTQPAAQAQSTIVIGDSGVKLPDVSAAVAADLAAGVGGKSAAAAVGGSALDAIKIEDSPPIKAETPPPQKSSSGPADGESNLQDLTQGLKHEPTEDRMTSEPASTAAASTAGADIKPEGAAISKEELEPAVAKEQAALTKATSLQPLSVRFDRSDVAKDEEGTTGAGSNNAQASFAVMAKPVDADASTAQAQASSIESSAPAATKSDKGLAAEPAGPSTEPGGISKPAEATQAVVPASSLAAASIAEASHFAVPAPGAAATSSAAGKAAAPANAAVVSSTAEGSKPPVILGCPKCRWAPKGCASCRAKCQAAGCVLPPPLAATNSGSLGVSDSKPSAAAAAALKAERPTTTRLCTWLSNRTAMLASVLKGTHKVAPATASHQPGQTRVTISAPANRLLSKSSGPVITTQQTLGPHPSLASASGAAYPMQSVMGAPANTGPWQQNAVQMSQMRQQQRQLQQQQLLAAQEQQRRALLLQQQQRERHTSLLLQQHQSAQLQQQQEGMSPAGQAQALQQQQLRMRQQQQQQGLRQQQLNQQHQQQLNQQLLQQQQRQMTAQQQVQRALVQQQGSRLQPQASAAYATAAQRAQYQQRPPASQAQTSYPPSENNACCIAKTAIMHNRPVDANPSSCVCKHSSLVLVSALD